MMEETPTDRMEASAARPSVGAVLRQAREARGLSVQEIAERVKFSVRQVEALERDDMEHLPQGTFLRGFIRSYARVLGLDEEGLLQSTHTRTEHHFDVADVQAGGAPLPVAGGEALRNRHLLLGALLVACLLLLFVWTQRDEEPVALVEPVVVAPAASAPAAASAVAGMPPQAAPAVQESKEPASKPVVLTVESEKVAIEKKTADVSMVRRAEAEPAQASFPKSTVPLEQLRKRPIHIEFVEESWMEIRDVNGEILLSRITPAGEEKWVGGSKRAPYQVTIGKAGAVRLYYHGKQVDLSHFDPAGVAKLVLE